MRFSELFERYYVWADWIVRVFAVGTFGYVLVRRGEIEWHSLLTVVAVLGVALIVAVQLSVRQIRKRVAAGIVRFQQEHRPLDATERLRQLTRDYLYIGRSFESMLEALEAARSHRGMAQKTAMRLLLADPENAAQVEYLRQNTAGELDAAAIRKDLCEKLLKTLAALEGFGRVEIRLHSGPFKGWLHLLDGEAMVFGMMPKGSDGLAAPAMELEPVKGRWTLFDHLLDWAEETWTRGKEVKDIRQWQKRLEMLAR